MKISILSIIFLAVLLVTHAGNAQENPKADTLSTRVSKNSNIKSENHHVEIVDGKCTVFEIQVARGGDPRIDAQITYGLIFEVSSGQTTFEMNHWAEINAYLEISRCRCINRGYNPITNGYIKGHQQENGNWEIEASVIAKGKDNGEDIPFKFKGIVSDH
ncbi:hypothetical protein C900_01427 [Fulvivirga imtechensis AK7]|uniref:Uncharacterized protein n=1 Tax=Fulvivirga imtechensis AK7 TaxID=1237149 RepID=L8K2Y2_9BACT|nr:hypothetical protein [Fulvivirga imtechensis]ELR73817.1 hypothetical protein C900_01427 [Fulvivirga imtechensis AK7]